MSWQILNYGRCSVPSASHTPSMWGCIPCKVFRLDHLTAVDLNSSVQNTRTKGFAYAKSFGTTNSPDDHQLPSHSQSYMSLAVRGGGKLAGGRSLGLPCGAVWWWDALTGVTLSLSNVTSGAVATSNAVARVPYGGVSARMVRSGAKH